MSETTQKLLDGFLFVKFDIPEFYEKNVKLLQFNRYREK
jgi:hypothetical protein